MSDVVEKQPLTEDYLKKMEQQWMDSHMTSPQMRIR